MLSLKIFFSKDEEEKLQIVEKDEEEKLQNLIRETIVMSGDTTEVEIYISGYIAKKKLKIVSKTATLNMPLGKSKRTMLIVHT